MVDPGKEFFGSVNTLMKKHAVKFQRSEAGNHRAQSFVERANRTLSERLFSHQYAQEMKTEGRSVEWVKRLPDVIKAMNNESSKITGKEVTEIKNNKPKYKRLIGSDEVRLPPGVKVRFLFAQGEDEGGEKCKQQTQFGVLRLMIFHEVLFKQISLCYIIYHKVHQKQVLSEKNFRLYLKTHNFHLIQFCNAHELEYEFYLHKLFSYHLHC